MLINRWKKILNKSLTKRQKGKCGETNWLHPPHLLFFSLFFLKHQLNLLFKTRAGHEWPMLRLLARHLIKCCLPLVYCRRRPVHFETHLLNETVESFDLRQTLVVDEEAEFCILAPLLDPCGVSKEPLAVPYWAAPGKTPVCQSFQRCADL